MARRRDLRELNETRGSRGQFTSETAYRLHQVRAARGRVRQMRKDKFRQLAEAREMLRLYRLMREGKSDPKLTRDGDLPGCRCIYHLRRVHEEERERAWQSLSVEERRLLDGVGPTHLRRGPLIY